MKKRKGLFIMLLTLKGIVLHETNAGDKGRFIDILTKEMGVVEVYVRGAKKVTGKSTGITQLFSYAEFCIEQKGEKYYYQSGKPIRIFYGLRENLLNLSLASYFSELLRTAVLKGTKSGEILRLTLNSFHFLDNSTKSPDILKPLFELRLAAELGFMPDVLMCKRCMAHLPKRLVFSTDEGCFWCSDCYAAMGRSENPYIYSMSQSGLEMIRFITLVETERLFSFRVNDKTLKDVSAFAEGYIRHHLGANFKTLEFWRSIRHNNDL